VACGSGRALGAVAASVAGAGGTVVGSVGPLLGLGLCSDPLFLAGGRGPLFSPCTRTPRVFRAFFFCSLSLRIVDLVPRVSLPAPPVLSPLVQFFGDNKPPVPGPCPEPTSSRWVFDVKTGAMLIFTWFPDDKVAVTSTQCSRYGEWSYDLNFYYGVTEGTLPEQVRLGLCATAHVRTHWRGYRGVFFGCMTWRCHAFRASLLTVSAPPCRLGGVSAWPMWFLASFSACGWSCSHSLR